MGGGDPTASGSWLRNREVTSMAENNPSTARVVLTVTRDSRKFLNVLHMARSDGNELSASDLLSMANVVADWWQNSYRQTCNPSVVGESVVATKNDPTDPLQQTVYINGPGTLSGGGNDPANVTAAISWRTGLAGRKYRGRFFHFSPNGLGINSNDTFQGSTLLSFTNVGSYLLSHALTAALRVIIFHRATNTYTPSLETIVDQLVDSQHRRLAARGI